MPKKKAKKVAKKKAPAKKKAARKHAKRKIFKNMPNSYTVTGADGRIKDVVSRKRSAAADRRSKSGKTPRYRGQGHLGDY